MVQTAQRHDVCNLRLLVWTAKGGGARLRLIIQISSSHISIQRAAKGASRLLINTSLSLRLLIVLLVIVKLFPLQKAQAEKSALNICTAAFKAFHASVLNLPDVNHRACELCKASGNPASPSASPAGLCGPSPGDTEPARTESGGIWIFSQHQILQEKKGSVKYAKIWQQQQLDSEEDVKNNQ